LSPSDDGATASKMRAQHSTTLVVVVANANDHTEPTFIASLNGLSGFVLEVETRGHQVVLCLAQPGGSQAIP